MSDCQEKAQRAESIPATAGCTPTTLFTLKRRGTGMKKVGKVILIEIAGVILAMILVNQITVYPFVWSFRALMSITGNQGNVGNYGDVIDSVQEIAQVKVPIDGYPDASFTVYRPKDNQEILPVIVYIHGGGWSLGSAQSVAWFAKLLSSNGYAVCNVDYALAPEHPFPDSTCQLAEVINYIYEHANDYGFNHDKIFIGGNSAGAHLSSQLGALFTDEKYARQLGIDSRVPANAIHGLLLFNGVIILIQPGTAVFLPLESGRGRTPDGRITEHMSGWTKCQRLNILR